MSERPNTSSRVVDRRMKKTAGEVRFIKDRGGDHSEWAWNTPGASERSIDPDYKFSAKNLEPLARVLRSALMALGHIQTARTTFTKIKGQSISPDGNLGGKGYVMTIKDIRKQLSNCDEALSSITDTIYDEMQAVHWHPAVDDSGGDPRARPEVKDIMDDVEEIREDPEEWAEGEEADMGGTSKTASAKSAWYECGRSDEEIEQVRPNLFGASPRECRRRRRALMASVNRVTARYLARRDG